jgi:polyisoprenoid-binding protein YceI
MSTKNIVVIGVSGLVVLIALGLDVFNVLFTTNIAPSGALTAIPVVINTAAPSTATSQPADQTTDTTTAAASPTSAATTSAAVAAGSTAASASSASVSGLAVYQIVPDKSQLSFSIYEELGGQPITVVGTTTQVAGQLALNSQDLSQTRVGVIQVDARGLATDNHRRNGAIRNFILNSDLYEYIIFTPKSVTGLRGTAQAGQSFTF